MINQGTGFKKSLASSWAHLLLISLIITIPGRTANTTETPPAAPEGPKEPSPNLLQKDLEFWTNVYGKYTSEEALIHDAKYTQIIYEVLDLKQNRMSRVALARSKKLTYRALLLSIHKKQDQPETFTPEEARIFAFYQPISEPNKFLNAAHRKRIRFQLGQKDKFQEGLYESGRYLPLMEQIFRESGLPVELTRLPFVESSFNVHARSKVGASGIWQFMPSTARLFLRIDDAVDERNDPILATEAAVKLLQLNYSSLGSWPLAVTAYNHGRIGVMRAVRKLGSDELEDLLEGYKSRTFGFASSNFFATFQAAVEVEKNAEKYFGDVNRAEPLKMFEVTVPDYIRMRDLSRYLHLNKSKIRDLNPALTSEVFTGKLFIPAGYRLRLPWDGKMDRELASKSFATSYLKIPRAFKRKYQRELTSDRRVVER